MVGDALEKNFGLFVLLLPSYVPKEDGVLN